MAQFPYRSALAIAAVTLPFLSAPAQGQAASTTLSPALYDAHWKVVVVPYEGAVPTFTTAKLTHPHRVYFDFNGKFKGRYPSGPVMRHPSLVRWAMAPRGDNQVRLTLTFNAPMDVKVIHNARRKMLVLVPQAPGAKASPSPAATAAPSRPPASSPMPAGYSAVGTARYDAARGAIVVPYSGDLPAHESEALTNPPRVYFDFKGTYARTASSAPVTGHASLVRWAQGPRDPGTTRVTLTFQAPTKVRVSQDLVRREIILTPAGPSGSPTPAATPAPPTPRPSLAPPSLQPPLIPGPESDRRSPEPAEPLPEGASAQPLP